MHGKCSRKTNSGFSSIKMVVVVVVLCIVAAINAPRMSSGPGNARSNPTKHHLAVIRDAIELHKSRTNAYPTAETITVDLSMYVRDGFPAPGVGAGKGNATVKASTQDPIGDLSGTEGWIYNETTREFRVNDAAYLVW